MPGTESIYVGEFMGTPVSSPNTVFTIAYGAFLDRKDVEDKYYILFRNKREIARGQTNSRIDTATVDDHGNFGLSLIGNMKNDTTIVLFRSNGTEYARFTTDKFLYFFKIVEEGASLFWGVDNAVRKTDIASRTDAFEFSVPHRVYPSDGIIDLENNIVLLKDSDRGYYRFGFDGSFLDFESWFSNYASGCDGESLYLLILETFRLQKDSTTTEDYTNAALWLEEALRRGIRESYSIKVCDVYTYLSSVYRMIGDSERALDAERKASDTLDGFRRIDRAASQLEKLGDPPDLRAARSILDDLEKVKPTERIFDYPNYSGRLFRMKGAIHELLGETLEAIEAYQRALQINSKIGCKRDLEKLRKEFAKGGEAH